jgi:hypothetical protein
MSKIIQIADRLGKSPATVYKMIDGSREAKPEEKAILTEELGRDAGEACDWSALNDALAAENQRLVLSNIELASENARHVRGSKTALLFYGAMLAVCLTIGLVAYKPVIWDYVAHKAYHDEITEAKIAMLEQRIETLTIALDAAIAVDYKWSVIFDKQDEKIEDIKTKMGEVSK